MDNNRDAKWYEKNRGLCNEGLPMELLTVEHATMEEICAVFGPKEDKNGWKFKDYVAADAATKIEELYRRVYDHASVTNNQLTLKFCRALLAQSKGHKVNWAAHAANSRRVRLQTYYKRAESEEKKRELGDFRFLSTRSSS